jgi:Chitobiase/beta-hexosaminidase C-terminal domain
MQIMLKFYKSFRCNEMLPLSPAFKYLLLLMLTVVASPLSAQTPSKAYPGTAWQVRGRWRAMGKSLPIVSGDTIQPGTLLQPNVSAGEQSIIVLLPDGQRLQFECFTAKDCARGFRVPPLFRTPEPFAVEMMARIRAAILHDQKDSGIAGKPKSENNLPQDEALVILMPDNRVRITGLAGKLPNGRYTYALQALDQHAPARVHLVLQKQGPLITVPLPSPGLYKLRIADNLGTPRIRIFFAAVTATQAPRLKASYAKATALLKQWNNDYFDWPVHDLQRAYLTSLMLDLKPPSGAAQPSSTAKEVRSADFASEPRFLPAPGVYTRITPVELRCTTPDAIMHYTINGSEPTDISPVYRAPIMLVGSDLIVKSFASAPGKKDSAVVTGIYRIPE